MYHITLINKRKKVCIFDIEDREHIVKGFATQYLMGTKFNFDENELQNKNITNLRIIETELTISKIVKNLNNERLKEKLKENKVPIMLTKEIVIYNDSIGNNITDIILKEAEEFRKELGL